MKIQKLLTKLDWKPKLSKKKITIASVAILAIGIAALQFFKKEAPNYITYQLQKGDLIREINVTGTINPVNIIEVGTQVTAIIKKIYVNYNDKVTKDQMLAQLDTSLLARQVEIDKGALDKAKANMDYAKLMRDRNKKLYESGYIARADYDQYNTAYKTTSADYESALAQYRKSQRNVNLATIISPVSGIIISKEVEEGQTVASSLQAPSLFKIAEDLAKMQIEVSVSEADISSIQNQQAVTFTVDAYRDLEFYGTINQIRLNPTTDQNVVTYTVIINIDNSDLKLLPGMTAFVNILIDKRSNVFKAPTDLFKFKPKDFDDNLYNNLAKDEAIIYIINKGSKLSPIKVKKGLSNEFETEIISEQLHDGDKIVQDLLTKKVPAASNTNRRPGF